MVSLYERVAAERTHLRQVRQALTAAVEQGAQGEAAYVPFYLAIAEYFEVAMDRLHAQDIRLGDLLREKADMSAPAMQQAMAELDDRLTRNQEYLAKMLAARDDLQERGEAVLPEFEQAGGDYAAFIVATMGHHPGTANPAQELFSKEDWAFMADVSEADQLREQQLYAQVFASVPAGLKLPE